MVHAKSQKMLLFVPGWLLNRPARSFQLLLQTFKLRFYVLGRWEQGWEVRELVHDEPGLKPLTVQKNAGESQGSRSPNLYILIVTVEICNYNQLLLCNINGLVPFCRLMDQSVDSALFFFPFVLVLNCMLNSLDFFVFCISLSLYFPLALSLRMSFLF